MTRSNIANALSNYSRTNRMPWSFLEMPSWRSKMSIKRSAIIRKRWRLGLRTLMAITISVLLCRRKVKQSELRANWKSRNSSKRMEAGIDLGSSAPIMRMVPAVKFQRFVQTFSQLHLWCPIQSLFDLPEISVVVADVDRLSLFGKRNYVVAAAAIPLDKQSRQLLQHDMFGMTEVEHLTVGIAARRGPQQRLDHVRYEIKVALLFSSSENLQRLLLDQLSNPNAKKRLPRVRYAHSGPVSIR